VQLSGSAASRSATPAMRADSASAESADFSGAAGVPQKDDDAGRRAAGAVAVAGDAGRDASGDGGREDGADIGAVR
jgi:hypothetical protein